MTTQREQLIQAWLEDVLRSDQFEINYLAGDASFRRYARVIQNNKSFMLMDAPPEKEDCVPFVKIDEFLDQNGVKVPHIVAKDLDLGFLLLEDFGDVLLSSLLNTDTVDRYYTQAFEQLIQLQRIDGLTQFPEYSYEKLMTEMQLFTEWLLPALNIVPSEQEHKMVENTFALLAHHAIQQPQVIVHRDFHSRNLMQLPNEKQLGVIDFQDAVIGADTYDLISITRDAYVQWEPEQVTHWFKNFYDMLPLEAKHNRSFNQFKKDADLMAMQRHIKILGIFVRLFKRDGKAGYLKDLPRVMWYVVHQAQDYPELKEFNTWLQNTVLPRFNQEYGVYVK